MWFRDVRQLLFVATFGLVLALSACSSCDDDASAVDPCDGVACPASGVCVDGACRPRDEADTGVNADDTGTGTDVGDDDTETTRGDDTGTPDTSITGDTAGDDTGETPCDSCGRLEADPATVSMNVGAVGRTSERRVLLASTGERAVHILDVSLMGSNQGFQVVDTPIDVTLQPGETEEFGVRYTAPFLGVATATVRVFTDIPSVVDIPVSVTVKTGDEPCIDLQPEVLNFGTIARGSSRTIITTAANCGGGDLTINELARGSFFGQATSATFQWAGTPGAPAILAPGETMAVAVTYTPGRAGLDLGYMEVRNNSADNPTGRVDLRATSEAPPIEDQDLHIRLEWDADNSDVDMHFLKDSDPAFDCPLDCFYANPNPDWAVQGDWTDDPFLDLDDVDGLGPENINVQTLTPGTYRVFMHYYDDTYDDSSPTSTNATVQVFYNGVLQQEWTEFLDGTNRIWEVARIEWPSGTITTLGTLSTTNHRSCR